LKLLAIRNVAVNESVRNLGEFAESKALKVGPTNNEHLHSVITRLITAPLTVTRECYQVT
jgi:hypothetical protein